MGREGGEKRGQHWKGMGEDEGGKRIEKEEEMNTNSFNRGEKGER